MAHGRGALDVGLCAAHHLHGVHRGFVRVRGLAPQGLTWELGERDGASAAEAGLAGLAGLAGVAA